ncbi:MAG: mevalonate kinase [Candidatus Aenigmarchaeota archaeon]|nr:mevalonate kinase [Candidatus Aenigmarchaeota archaeon]
MIKVSAPAKCHIIGEHAVVYGHPAIIAAVGMRIYIEAEKSGVIELKDDRWKTKRAWAVHDAYEASHKAAEMWNECMKKKDFTELLCWSKTGNSYDNYWKAMIGTVLRLADASSGISLHITKCDIPTGSGLGSSSATAVAVVKAISEAYGKSLTDERINEIAYECEKLIHGTPSGGDNSASCFGGLIWFRKVQPKNEIVSLRKEIPHKLEKFILIYSGEPKKNTGELIQMVRDIPESERNPKMQELDRMAHEMKEVLKKKNYKRMKEIINRTNEILASFGLSTPETEEISRKIISLGGAAKMCGACGGGMMLAWHDKPKKILDAMKEMGFDAYAADLAVEGVRNERV